MKSPLASVLVNGLLFATYHVHVIWLMPQMILTDWIYAYITKRYRSYWMGALFHGLDALFLLVLFPLAGLDDDSVSEWLQVHSGNLLMNC